MIQQGRGRLVDGLGREEAPTEVPVAGGGGGVALGGRGATAGVFSTVAIVGLGRAVSGEVC